MALFQQSVLKKHIETLNNAVISQKWEKFQAHFLNATIQQNIRKSKEEQYQEGFLRDLFVNIFGYILNPTEHFNLTTELKNITNSKKVDGAIVIDGKAIGVIELKGTDTTDLAKIEAQAFGYKTNQPGCNYVITSNFEKLRFYIDNTTQYQEFNLFTLTKDEFTVLYCCLDWESISNNLPTNLLNQSVSKENAITKQLYNDYSAFKRGLYNNLVELNPQHDKLLLFKKTQKLLDRFLFIFFAEDRLLLPTNLIRRINKEWENLQKMRIPVSLYDRYVMYFHDLNEGAKVTLPAFGKKTSEAIEETHEIFAYNGGLFKNDEFLDNLKINDQLLYEHTHKMSDYDFQSEVDVNILGHIFENSLNEIDEIKSEIEGNVVDKTKTKRKKDGVFYTPKYITKYIVDNTVGKLCTEKKEEIQLIEEEYHTEKNLQTKTKKALLDKLTTYREWLLQLTICDPACGSGAFLNQALEFLIEEHTYIDELQAKLMGDSLVLSDVENSILENNLYGVDLNDESIEIAKLSLWLRTAQKGRKLNSLNNNIKCGNSLIDDPEVAGEKAFSWEKEFPEVFAPSSGSRDGFDVIIGNPPYVQLQSSKELSESLEKQGYFSFEKTSDLYCLFYELGSKILNSKGLLGFITSNKWMRANYGKSIRKFLIENTSPYLLIDLGAGIFESATVDSNILFFAKSNKKKSFFAIDLIKEKVVSDFSLFENKKIEISPTNDEIWSISNPIEFQIKKKIESKGKQLKNWNIDIYRGILTGFNEAFIINEEIKDELIKLDSKNQKIIVPLLRGRDIHRYCSTFQNLYLINTHNGYKNIPAIDINHYPSIKEHLDKYWSQISKRGDKGVTPYNLRNCAYLDDFQKTNIFYPDISQRLSFCLVDNIYVNNTGYFLRTDFKYILPILNSSLINYYYKTISAQLGENAVRSFTIYIENIPIIELKTDKQQPFIDKADLMLSLNKDFQQSTQKFTTYFTSQYHLEKISGKLEKWYELSFVDFIKELNKAIKTAKGTPLTKKDEFEWMELFEDNKKKALALKAEIDKTDKEIDQMVYALYGLTEEEIKIVETV